MWNIWEVLNKGSLISTSYVADISTSLTGSSGIANIGTFREGLPRGFCNPTVGASCGAFADSSVSNVESNPEPFFGRALS